MIKKKILIFSIQHPVRQHLQTNYPQRKKKKEKRCNRSIRTNHVHRWRVMTDGEIPRPAGILEKKNFLSYPVNSRRRARERHRVLGKGRARATHERKLTERNAVCEERTDPR